MNEYQPRPVLRPKPIDRRPLPDYSKASPGQLRRSQAVQFTRLIGADIGHVIVKSAAFGVQAFRFLTGADDHMDWDPNIIGLRPDLDEKERAAKEQLKAIWQEMSRRRSLRQQQLHRS